MAVRPIDAEKYMELLKEQYLHHKSMGNRQMAKAWQGAMQLLYDMPTLTPPNEWASVDERLPEHLQDVLVLYGNGRVDIDWVDSLGNFAFDSLYGRATHWMPLPAPPESQKEGEE